MTSTDESLHGDRAAAPGSDERLQHWEAALARDTVPDFVLDRLHAADGGRLPWISTMTPIELRLARTHGMRPLAMVSGTCWLHYSYSWTDGHRQGWHKALARMKAEAIAAGANAIVDVKMRRIDLPLGVSMDFTLVGTAVRFDRLPASPDPIVATVSALEFGRLLDLGIVPVGIGIGAHFECLRGGGFNARGLSIDGSGSWVNQALTDLSGFWERIRRTALEELRRDTQAQGNGALAHTHWGQILKFEDNNLPCFLGRHIVIGTIIDRDPRIGISLGVQTVMDMSAGVALSPDRRKSTAHIDIGNHQEGAV